MEGKGPVTDCYLPQFHWSITSQLVYSKPYIRIFVCRKNYEKDLQHLTPYFAAVLRVFPKHFDVLVILEKYFACAVLALNYPKTSPPGL